MVLDKDDGLGSNTQVLSSTGSNLWLMLPQVKRVKQVQRWTWCSRTNGAKGEPGASGTNGAKNNWSKRHIYNNGTNGERGKGEQKVTKVIKVILDLKVLLDKVKHIFRCLRYIQGYLLVLCKWHLWFNYFLIYNF